MYVRTGAVPTAAHIPDDIAPMHRPAGLHSDGAHVAIAGGDAAAVVDAHEPAVAPFHWASCTVPSRRGPNGRTVIHGDIDAGMVITAAAPEGIRPQSKRRN